MKIVGWLFMCHLYGIGTGTGLNDPGSGKNEKTFLEVVKNNLRRYNEDYADSIRTVTILGSYGGRRGMNVDPIYYDSQKRSTEESNVDQTSKTQKVKAYNTHKRLKLNKLYNILNTRLNNPPLILGETKHKTTRTNSKHKTKNAMLFELATANSKTSNVSHSSHVTDVTHATHVTDMTHATHVTDMTHATHVTDMTHATHVTQTTKPTNTGGNKTEEKAHVRSETKYIIDTKRKNLIKSWLKDRIPYQMKKHASREELEFQAPLDMAPLDMAPALGSRMQLKRLKGRLCDRNVLSPEGPKYDRHGMQYRNAFALNNGQPYDSTPPPRKLLPRCCNCCKKSVLGCE